METVGIMTARPGPKSQKREGGKTQNAWNEQKMSVKKG